MRARYVALAVCLALVGCGEQSKVDPKAKVHVTGQAVTPTGAPLVGRAVRLGSGVSADDATLGVLTLGLACTTGICSGKVFDTTTDATGHYGLSLTGRDTQGSFGKVRSELVTVSAAPTANQVSGAATSARFAIQTTTVTLPVLRLVDPRLTVRDARPAVLTHWSTTSPGPYDLTFETSAVLPVWRVTTSTSEVSLDARLLESSSGRVVVGGGSSDRIEGSDVDLRWRSPGIGYAADTGTPVSRGAHCTFDGAAARSGECGLTDGDLTTAVTAPSTCPSPAGASTAPCTRATAATIDLGSPARADLVVVRGCASTCAVQGSADGKAFHPLGVVSSEYAALHLTATPLRAVRIGLGTQGLREVSVWTPLTTPAALKPIPSLSRLRARYSTAGKHPYQRTVLLLLAGALLLALLLTLAFVAGTRRRSPHPGPR